MADQSIPKERRKVTELLNIEAEIQKVWDAKKPFEVDAPEDET
jgi:leucyl-tRNA synthetase